ncbi:hypothetical protein [Streptomyces sp. NPDC020597]
MRWAEDDARTRLPDLVERALTAAFGERPADPGHPAPGGNSPS